MVRRDPVGQLLHLALDRNVEHGSLGLSAGRADLLCGLLRGVGVDVRTDDRGACAGERECGPTADSAAGTGDDGDLAVDAERLDEGGGVHLVSPLLVRVAADRRSGHGSREE